MSKNKGVLWPWWSVLECLLEWQPLLSLLCGSLPRKERGTHQKQLSGHCTWVAVTRGRPREWQFNNDCDRQFLGLQQCLVCCFQALDPRTQERHPKAGVPTPSHYQNRLRTCWKAFSVEAAQMGLAKLSLLPSVSRIPLSGIPLGQKTLHTSKQLVGIYLM